MFRFTLVLLSLIFFQLPVSESIAGQGNAAKQELKLATFNTGLAHGHVGFAEQRLINVIKTIQDADADVLCLQELWEKNDLKAVLRKVSRQYPYKAVDRLGPFRAPQCRLHKVVPAFSCVNSACLGNNEGGNESHSLLQCALANCEPQIVELRHQCFACLSDSLVRRNPIVGAAECVSFGHPYVFKGKNGLLLLSKYPLMDIEVVNLSSTQVKRSVIMAEAVVGSDKSIDVACTHLQNRSDVPYLGEVAEDWESEQAVQIEELLRSINRYSARQGLSNGMVLMGDLNAGPEIAESTGEFANNFEKLLRGGFAFHGSVIAKQPSCSWCGGENPLILEDSHSHLIDHILTRNPSAFGTAIDVKSMQRFGTHSYSVFQEGQWLNLPASDHYGYQADIVLQP